MTVAIFGSINMDVIAYLDRLPKPGETLHGSGYKMGLGGKGANQAVAARKLGSEVRFIGRTGADSFGDAARAELTSYDVDLTHIRRDEGSATGIAIIKVGEGGQNMITVIAGANGAVDQSDAQAAKADLEQARVLLLQLEVPLKGALAAAKIVRGKGGTVILDPAPAPKEPFSADIIAAVDVVTPNESETAGLLGWQPATPDDALRAARELKSKGFRTALVKLGAKGVAFSGPTEEGFVPPFKVTAIDTVAAGDSFNGGLAVALDEGKSLAEAVRFAAASGALSTTKKGASAAAPTRAEIDAFLAAQ
ncbi:ribokinase [Aestuariivirga sp. YIM B02566]|uniref:Ribokinase n=1 Tax=Taklimakanibacter albus TaxID=2800327 RepID=A0ACC5R8Y0_9HYPH|nr:ribokinase [Aestuariivirga sp. YIM B02566]MBK1869057.1 ribokinase [Aestuariivirga sp. YIM B02566]